MSSRILTGDCRAMLATLPAESVQTCVTSPPYFALRSYLDGNDPNKPLEIGSEDTPDAYVSALVEVFRGVKRVLRNDGLAFINLGDLYIGKRLQMMPARVALALQADGWWLRSAIVWHKPSPMPESCTDRPTSAYEMVFMLAKAERYFYDVDAITEPAADSTRARAAKGYAVGGTNAPDRGDAGQITRPFSDKPRNARNVWTIATTPYPESHYAVMPPALAERCILAGSRPGDTVLDCFMGAGTTLLVADRLQRDAVGIELNPTYASLAADRITADAPLFAEVAD